MTFTNLLTHEVIVSRLTAVSGNKTAFSTVTAEYVSIHRISDEKAVMIGQAVGKTYRMYMEENADIKEEDKLKDEDGNEYKVASITIPSSLGLFTHKECVIIKVKSTY